LERRDRLAFLPAALEIVETPASPLGRATGGVIILFFLAALAWATLSKVEIVTTAPGSIMPSGRTKQVQPLESGTVRAIRVQEGESVLSGQLLIELDDTASAAERNRTAAELLAARLDIARLSALLGDGEDPAGGFRPPPEASAAQVGVARLRLASQLAERDARLAALDRQRAQFAAAREAILATIAKLAALQPILRERAEMRKTLLDHEYGSRLTYLGEQQQLVENERELVVQQSRLGEAEATLAAVAEQRRQAVAEFARGQLADLAQAEEKMEELDQALVEATRRQQLHRLVAPADGTVQQLMVHSIGGVVMPGQTLLVVVPSGSPLEVEAEVPNAEIGFVHPGQFATVKIETFDFTRYGACRGKVLGLSRDAVAPAEPRPAQPGPAAYRARVSLDCETLRVGADPAELRPGMAVSVEIRTGQRRVIDYLLSPLLNQSHDSLRER
jgi:hemolysin D